MVIDTVIGITNVEVAGGVRVTVSTKVGAATPVGAGAGDTICT